MSEDAVKITFNLFLSPEDDLAILFLYSLRVSFSGGSTSNPSGLLAGPPLPSNSDFALWEVLALALFKGFIQFLSMHLSSARPSSPAQRWGPPGLGQGLTSELSAAIWLILLQFSSETPELGSAGDTPASLSSFCHVLGDGTQSSVPSTVLGEFSLCGAYRDCLASFSTVSVRIHLVFSNWALGIFSRWWGWCSDWNDWIFSFFLLLSIESRGRTGPGWNKDGKFLVVVFYFLIWLFVQSIRQEMFIFLNLSTEKGGVSRRNNVIVKLLWSHGSRHRESIQGIEARVLEHFISIGGNREVINCQYFQNFPFSGANIAACQSWCHTSNITFPPWKLEAWGGAPHEASHRGRQDHKSDLVLLLTSTVENIFSSVISYWILIWKNDGLRLSSSFWSVWVCE